MGINVNAKTLSPSTRVFNLLIYSIYFFGAKFPEDPILGFIHDV